MLTFEFTNIENTVNLSKHKPILINLRTGEKNIFRDGTMKYLVLGLELNERGVLFERFFATGCRCARCAPGATEAFQVVSWIRMKFTEIQPKFQSINAQRTVPYIPSS